MMRTTTRERDARRAGASADTDDALFLAQMLATCPDTIYVCDMATRRAVFRTRRLHEVLGYRADEVEAPEAIIPQQLLHPDDRLDIDDLFQRIGGLARGEHVDLFLRMREKAGGWRQFRSRIAPLRWSRGRVTTFMGVLADTTAEYEAQAVLRRAKERADEANAAKTRFMADMSHEIRTPLYALVASFDLLAREGLTARQAAIVDAGQRAGEHLAQLVNDALDIAAVEAGRLEIQSDVFRVADLVRDLVATFGPRADAKGLAFLALERPGVPELVTGDARRLRQAASNFLSNSIKFTERGYVHLVVSATPVGPGRTALKLTVADSGPGLSGELQARLFQRFSRGEHAGGPIPGAGLGLAITAGLASAMGGRVGVRSWPGHGATFWIEVPLAIMEADRSVEAAAPQVGAASTFGAATVLVVDDSPDNLRMTAAMVEALGLCAVRACDGEAALVAARERRPDLILMDCQMPGMDGLETVRRLRAGGYAAPVLALTANITPEKRAACGAAGFDEVLTKPLRLAQLERRLKSRLAPEKEVP